MLAVAILAAGKGTRMKSTLPKVLHQLSGISLVQRVLNTCSELNPNDIYLIVGHESEKVERSIGESSNINNINFVVQEPQNGTGHAIQILAKKLKNFKGTLLVLNGDVPLIKASTLKELINMHEDESADASIITTNIDNPFGYGRVFQRGKNYVDKIVEEKDCSYQESLNTTINAGIYCFNWEKLNTTLVNLSSNNNQNEIYLTDTLSILEKTLSLNIKDSDQLQGINSRVDLAKCEEILQNQIKEKHMLNGVTIVNCGSCTISEESKIEMDVVIEANTHIRGNSIISKNCKIGPNTFIENSFVGKNSKVVNSMIFNSEIMDQVTIGPFSHIRPQTKILANSKIGNFVEIKNSELEQFVKVNHLSYIGDSTIGKSTNVGAGCITANFDGLQKHKTYIGENCSLGSNTVMVAPINIGKSVTTGAGSVITKNVNNNSLAISRSKQININNWKKK